MISGEPDGTAALAEVTPIHETDGQEVRQRISQLTDYLRAQDQEADDLGRLPDATTARLRDTGLMRMLMPRRYGGYEASPREFFEAVMEVAAASPNAGWVCGVVGGHPWPLALTDHRLQDELWGADHDTWIASPYAPLGKARRVEGGYTFSGRWPFSSGTDACQWVVLGGRIVDDNGADMAPPQIRHFLLPRSDYQVVEGSWQVMGLKGTGSKDVIVEDAHVPEHRMYDPSLYEDGTAARMAGVDTPLYNMPLTFMFDCGIVAATLGIATGALAAFTEQVAARQSMTWGKMSSNPYQLAALGEAEADIEASRLHILHDVDELYSMVESGGTVSLEQRVRARRNQVAATRRALNAIDRLFTYAGGGALRLELPLQRYWRDLHAAMQHNVNFAEPFYQASSLMRFGQPLPPNIRV